MSTAVFSDAQIGERYNDIFHVMDGFCSIYNVDAEMDLEIDPSLLYLATVAIYDDIARYKEYHLISPSKQRSNAVKRIAYAAKWFMHFSPLIFPKIGHLTGVVSRPHDGLANALFVIYYSILNVELMTKKKVYFSDDLTYKLVYDLLYRNFSSEALIIAFDIIVSIALGNDTVIVI